jgi:hypothetical protein
VVLVARFAAVAAGFALLLAAGGAGGEAGIGVLALGIAVTVLAERRLSRLSASRRQLYEGTSSDTSWMAYGMALHGGGAGGCPPDSGGGWNC